MTSKTPVYGMPLPEENDNYSLSIVNEVTQKTERALVAHDDKLAEVTSQMREKADLNAPALTGAATLNGRAVATATPPQQISLPLRANFQQLTSACTYCKNQFDEVMVNFDVKTVDGSYITGQYIADLPQEFRPAETTKGTAAVTAVGGAVFGTSGICYIASNGEIYLSFPSAARAQAGVGSLIFRANK